MDKKEVIALLNGDGWIFCNIEVQKYMLFKNPSSIEEIFLGERFIEISSQPVSFDFIDGDSKQLREYLEFI